MAKRRTKNVWDTHKLRVALRFKSRVSIKESFCLLFVGERKGKCCGGVFYNSISQLFCVMKDNMFRKFRHWMIYAFHAENDALVRAGNDLWKNTVGGEFLMRVCWVSVGPLRGKLGPNKVTKKVNLKANRGYATNLNLFTSDKTLFPTKPSNSATHSKHFKHQPTRERKFIIFPKVLSICVYT